MTNSKSILEIKIWVFFYDIPEENNFSCRLVDAADPQQFAANSISLGDPVCCSMSGVFAVTVDGIPINGGFDQFVKNGPFVPYFDVNAISTYAKWLTAVAELLKGKKHFEVPAHDDEGAVHFFRTPEAEIYFERGKEQPELHRVSLLEFGCQMLREGKKLEIFVAQVATVLKNQLGEVGLEKVRQKMLQDRINEVDSWEISRKNEKLEQALLDFERG